MNTKKLHYGLLAGVLVATAGAGVSYGMGPWGSGGFPGSLPEGAPSFLTDGSFEGFNGTVPEGAPSFLTDGSFSGFGEGMPEGIPEGAPSFLTDGSFEGFNGTVPEGAPSFLTDGSFSGFGEGMPEGMPEEMPSYFVAGDYEEYAEFAEENGLPVMEEEQFEEKAEMAVTREEGHEAALGGDYDEWRSIVGDDKLPDINEDNFYLVTDMALAQESGDEDQIESAKQALDEAGLEKPTRPEGTPFGGESAPEAVSELSEEEKSSLLDKLMDQIRGLLGLL